MKRIVSTVLLFAALGTAAAFGQASQAKQDREALMRANNGAMRALRPLGTAFDAAAAKTQGQILVDNGGKIAAQYAAGTDQTDPDVLPVVWSDAAGFTAAVAKFSADAAKIGSATDGPSLQAAMMAVNADCNSCHMTYRKPQAPRPPTPPAAQ